MCKFYRLAGSVCDGDVLLSNGCYIVLVNAWDKDEIVKRINLLEFMKGDDGEPLDTVDPAYCGQIREGRNFAL